MRADVIAEIGINHQGDLSIAEQLVESAKRQGADYVKIQMRTPELCVPREEWHKPKLTPWGVTIDYIDYRHKMEMSDDAIRHLQRVASGKLFPSVFDIPSLERAQALGFSMVKIPSAMLTNAALVSAAADTNMHLILSTGMSHREEIIRSVDVAFRNRRASQVTIMHCNSSYPTADHEVNLRAINTLGSLFPGSKIGFSSHSKSPYPAIYSILMGARIVEVHFTLDRAWIGSDHSASLEESGLRLVCRERSRINRLLGDGILKLYRSEEAAREKLRGS